MRTTIRIDDHLLAEAKEAAARRGSTLTALIEDALRQALRTSAASTRERIPLPVHRGGRLRPGVDLDDSAALLDLMEEDDPPV
jgi:hypothetical protein